MTTRDRNTSDLFLAEAVDHYARRESRGELIRIVPTWTRWTFWFLMALLVVGGLFSVFGRIPEYVAGPEGSGGRGAARGGSWNPRRHPSLSGAAGGAGRSVGGDFAERWDRAVDRRGERSRQRGGNASWRAVLAGRAARCDRPRRCSVAGDRAAAASGFARERSCGGVPAIRRWNTTR